MSTTTLFPFEPASMSTAQLAAVSYLARYSGHTHALYTYQLREWFSWCEVHGLDPLTACSAPTSSCTSASSVAEG